MERMLNEVMVKSAHKDLYSDCVISKNRSFLMEKRKTGYHTLACRGPKQSASKAEAGDS